MSENLTFKSFTKSAFWIITLVGVGVMSRCLPHPPNFAALLAVALFAGTVVPGPLALIIPVLSAFLGDLYLGFHEGLWFVYLSLLPLSLMGLALPKLNRQPRTWATWAAFGLAGNVFFFLSTNLAVWWFSGMYPHTSEGLATCFVLALPFFHNGIVATWIYMSGFEAVRRLYLAALPWLATAA